MPWTRPTLTQIIERVESDITSRLTNDVPLLRVAALKVFARVWAAGMHIVHGFQEYLATNILPDKSETEWLDRNLASWGLKRNAATFSQGIITLTGVDTTVVPEGTIFLSDAGLEYETDAEVTITGGTVDVDVICRTAGEDGNLPSGAELTIQTPIIDLDDVATANGAISGGVDRETDSAARERLLARIANPPAGGSESDYEAWARSIEGVHKAWVFGDYYGAGSVAVVIAIDSDTDPTAPAALVTEVQDYIDEVRPVTAAVTVSSVTKVTFGIDIRITPNNETLRDSIEESLKAFLATEVIPGGTLYLSGVRKAVNVAGVQDFVIDDMQIDLGTIPIANYAFSNFEFPVLGTITVGTL